MINMYVVTIAKIITTVSIMKFAAWVITLLIILFAFSPTDSFLDDDNCSHRHQVKQNHKIINTIEKASMCCQDSQSKAIGSHMSILKGLITKAMTLTSVDKDNINV